MSQKTCSKCGYDPHDQMLTNCPECGGSLAATIGSAFNRLSPSEAERLALLAEECAEVIQIVGKILRHGYESCNPDAVHTTTNRELLETEIGHVEAAVQMLAVSDDVRGIAISSADLEKRTNVRRYLHHQDMPNGPDERPGEQNQKE